MGWLGCFQFRDFLQSEVHKPTSKLTRKQTNAMAYHDITDSRMYQRASSLADEIWALVDVWDWFPKKTVGDQLVRSIDSIGANLAESAGRYHVKDVIRFIYIARGSLRESQYWIERAKSRKLIEDDVATRLLSTLSQLLKELNGYIKYQRNRSVKEEPANYQTE